MREECEVSGCKEGQVSVNEWQVPFHVCVCPLMALTAISQHTPDKTEVSPSFCRSPAGATTPTLAHTPDMEHMQLCVCVHPTPMATQLITTHTVTTGFVRDQKRTVCASSKAGGPSTCRIVRSDTTHEMLCGHVTQPARPCV